MYIEVMLLHYFFCHLSAFLYTYICVRTLYVCMYVCMHTAVDLSPYWWGNNSGRGILNVSVEMQQRIEAGKYLVQKKCFQYLLNLLCFYCTGLASFTISTQRSRRCLTGNLEEGFVVSDY